VCHDAWNASFCPFGVVVYGGTAHPNKICLREISVTEYPLTGTLGTLRRVPGKHVKYTRPRT
jgi:hypothetical protein